MCACSMSVNSWVECEKLLSYVRPLHLFRLELQGLIGTCCIQGTTIGKGKNWQRKQLEMT